MCTSQLRKLLRLILTTNMSNRAIDRSTGVPLNNVPTLRLKASVITLDRTKVEALGDTQLATVFGVVATPWNTKVMSDTEEACKFLQRANMTAWGIRQWYPENSGNYGEPRFAQLYSIRWLSTSVPPASACFCHAVEPEPPVSYLRRGTK